jgi:hypothetical protein
MVKRRTQRAECAECGNRVVVRDDGSFGPHYRGEGGRIRWQNERRCPGGIDPNVEGTIFPVVPTGKKYAGPPPSEGEYSVRTVSGGLPSSGRRHR